MKQGYKPKTMEKEMKVLENRINVKIANAVEKIGEVFIFKQLYV